jgi:hypothetical protein
MEMVKIKDIKTGVIKEVRKSLASDYIGTGRFEFLKDNKKPNKFTTPKEEENEHKRFS